MRLVPLAFAALFALPLQAQPAAVKGVPIFETPAFAEQEGLVGALTRAGAFDRADQALQDLIRRYPDAPRLQIARAQLAISRDDPDQALAALAAAQTMGYGDIRRVLSRPGFRQVADDPRMQALLTTPPAPLSDRPFAPAQVVDGWGDVTPDNTIWDETLARLRAQFIVPPDMARRPAFTASIQPLQELNQLVRRGEAAGNVGDFYDNRDDGHSVPKDVTQTQVTRIRYGAEARQRNLHYGLNEKILFSGITFGNSSTALTGAGWRSQPRHALTTPFGAIRAWQLYDNNHIYVFPEHRDHDPRPAESGGKGGRGDLFPANTPLMLISQGSSGSDRGLLQAVQAILAAFRPEVKAFLRDHRLIAPTVQQIFRRGMAGIDSEDDYLSPKAHPTVFDPKNIQLDRMIRAAYAMTADQTPPRARISMAKRDRPIGPFAPVLDETLFVTPDAIAQLWRGGAGTRQYRLSANGSFDANGRALTYFWRIIRGDPKKIDIQRVAPDASAVEVTVNWHDETYSPGGLRSGRVDIALFAHNGVSISAPAFFSIAFPTHETRVYRDDPADGRPLSITYGPAKDGVYVDPVIWPSRRWTDMFHYDEQGRLTGWTRAYPNGRNAEFTSQGLRIRKTDALGRAKVAAEIRYDTKRAKNGRLIIQETRTGRAFRFKYAGKDDKVGVPVGN